ncbi:hypothetical protein [Chitinophaga sp.]|uniref:hypothetical protein n=1 Tax=Chitinophaga sp. TaxID=1869181 RepID=UPI0031D0420B
MRSSTVSTELNTGIYYSFVDVKFSDTGRIMANNLIGYSVENAGTILKSRHFGMNYNIKLLWQRIAGTGLNVINNEVEFYVNPEVTMFYYPGDTSADGVFVRFKAVTNSFNRGYPVLQVGYNSTLSLTKKK